MAHPLLQEGLRYHLLRLLRAPRVPGEFGPHRGGTRAMSGHMGKPPPLPQKKEENKRRTGVVFPFSVSVWFLGMSRKPSPKRAPSTPSPPPSYGRGQIVLGSFLRGLSGLLSAVFSFSFFFFGGVKTIRSEHLGGPTSADSATRFAVVGIFSAHLEGWWGGLQTNSFCHHTKGWKVMSSLIHC